MTAGTMPVDNVKHDRMQLYLDFLCLPTTANAIGREKVVTVTTSEIINNPTNYHSSQPEWPRWLGVRKSKESYLPFKGLVLDLMPILVPKDIVIMVCLIA